MEARNSISDVDKKNYVDNSLRKLRRVNYLVLDDIGAENVTNWVRDDILFPLLDYRMENKKTTLFTSNSNFEQLEKRLAINQYQQTDQIKAGRIMERIKTLVGNQQTIINGTSRRR